MSACDAELAPTIVPSTPTRPAETPKQVVTMIPTTAASVVVRPTAALRTVDVTFWYPYAAGSPEEAALVEQIKAASVAPDLAGIKIIAVRRSEGDLFDPYRAEVSTGGGPSLFVGPNDSLGDDARGKLIADITELARGRIEGYGKQAIDAMSLDSKLYGLPESLRGMALFYNKDLVRETPKTTDELLNAVRGGTRIQVSLGCYNQWGFYGAYGARIFDNNLAIVNTPQNQANLTAAFTFLNGWWALARKAGVPKSDADAAAPGKSGKRAATTNGTAKLSEFRKALGDKLGVAPLPAGPKGAASPLLGADGYFFNPNNTSEVAQAALRVALFLSNAEGQKRMAEQADHVPARTGLIYNNSLVKALENTFPNATVRPQFLTMGKYWGNFCGDSDIWDRGVAPADFVKNALEGATR